MNSRKLILILSTAALVANLANRPILGQIPRAGHVNIAKYRAAAVEQWESEISMLEAKDKAETHPQDSILFVGSSSILRWTDIAADMAPYHPIQRGFGGAKWSDVAVFVERLVFPHQFRAVVFFVGNDIAGRDSDKPAEEIAGLFDYVLEKVRKHNAKAPVFYVAVTPTPARWGAWREIKVANTAARAVCEREDNTYFIGTESLFFDGAGGLRVELFLDDELHQNRAGYVRWAAAIKSHLNTVLDGSD